MKIYVGFDDTDHIGADRGTGKLARWFEDALPEGCRMEGVLRQQLLIHHRIPYTSHNSAACVVLLVRDVNFLESIIEMAITHIQAHALDGSDPGVCVAHGDTGDLNRLIAFGRRCTETIVTQKDAMEAAFDFHLSGHGGTNDGIIGAAAAVGLTASNWCGRFIEYGRIRKFPDIVPISDLEHANVRVVSVDRDAKVPSNGDLVDTKGWLRPRLWGGEAVLLVTPKSKGIWESVGEKRGKGHRNRFSSLISEHKESAI
jgi:hypothetical protein